MNPEVASVSDVLVIGAGPVGLAAACMLREAGQAVTVVDAGPAARAQQDRRIIALSAGSRDILQGLGAWPGGDMTPIGTIHISQRGHFGRTELRASDFAVDALGHVAPAGVIASALLRRAESLGVDIRHNCPATAPDAWQARIATPQGDMSAQVLLWCEGRIDGEDALSRSREYDQHAIVTLAAPAKPHGHVAYERFTPHGPVALLPCGRDYAVVYTCRQQELDALMSESDAAFMRRLSGALGERVQFSSIAPRASWPLVLRMRADIVRGRQVWLGNAAQTLHPVAGQGLNLALRDVAQLADSLLPALSRGEPETESALRRYAARRRLDRQATGSFTDLLAQAFTLGAERPFLGPLAGHVRGAALALLDACPPARAFLGRRMMYGARGW
ncbi:FAD-dependent oxidoreductase [Methyloversatilis thermotolerans]|uniref:FAD-dependent oxidoreductase n=1 Tax=Methyloversatilis thermotolerans TaxID=1346290 RepID=UPI00036FAC0C|nr:FAD-dependent oxidoreductase [Methyloversatilis thermotolerans]